MILDKSEIRSVFIHESIFGYSHDWNVIAETLAGYGINAVFVNDQRIFSRRSNSEIQTAINAFHTYGIQYHSSINTIALSRDSSNPTATAAIMHTGSVYDEWQQCPIKVHDYLMSDLQNYLDTFPNVDGIMIDYMRYVVSDMCYCSECRASFEEWLGEGTITDWTPFYPSGSRWSEYADWRTLPVTKLVKDIHDLIESFNPNIKISEAAWQLFSDSAIYWRKWIGQDTAAWIKEGYLDFVAPMLYQKIIYGSGDDALESRIDACLKYWMGGQPEGPIPLVALLRVDWSVDLTPEEFKAQIDYVRSRGLDGWAIWRYGGPGDDEPNPDIRNYLSVIDLPPAFSIKNIKFFKGTDGITVTWETDLLATSKVEYSTSPLFTTTWEMQGGFPFWWIRYNKGLIIEDANLKTLHNLKIPLGTDVYFRVQSQNSGGIITSTAYYTGELLPETITPWTGQLEEGTYIVTMPSQVTVNGDVYNFSRWEDGSTNPTKTINLTSDMTITATYAKVVPITHTLTITAGAGGTTNPAPGAYTIAEGQTQQVTAIADANYRFVNWLLDGVTRTENPITITMNQDHNLEAVFEYVPPPPLKVTLSGIIKDSKTSAPIAGATVTADGYADVTETDGSYVFQDIPAQQYTLTITKDGYNTQTLTVDASSGGTIPVDVSLDVVSPPPTIPLWTIPLGFILVAGVIYLGTKKG